MKTNAFRDHHRAYDRRRRRLVAAGLWQPYVDAAPVRAHIHELRRHHIGRYRLAAIAGVSESIIVRVAQPRRERLPRHIAERILAVTPESVAPLYTDATGSARRLQALVADGWLQTELAARIGWKVKNFSNIIMARKPRVTMSTAHKITVMFEELALEHPPTRARAGRAFTQAAKYGWVGRDMWTDDTIDDPAAKPRTPGDFIDEIAIDLAVAGDRRVAASLTRRERREVVRILSPRAISSRSLANLLGVDQRTVQYDRYVISRQAAA